MIEILNIMDLIPGVEIYYSLRDVPDENWNLKWESNFQPVTISNQVYVRAEYHPVNEAFMHEIVIQPRMAFGTGHHATTSLMMQFMLDMDFDGKKVLDMGCGTGILGILARKLGAAGVIAIDIDPNSVENTIVNCRVNNVNEVVALQGDADLLTGMEYDIVLANINRNIIVADVCRYSQVLKTDGTLLVSGFYDHDLDLIAQAASEEGLSLERSGIKDKWCCAQFKKN
jgi:ribosomal protein L11 methyltransferase